MEIFSTVRPATLENLSLMRRELTRKLRDLRLDSGLIEDMQLAIMELATNAIRHAGKAPTTMALSASIDGSALAVVIEDDGAPWPQLVERIEHAKRSISQRDAESGRGLMLSARAIDRVDYKAGPPNRLSLWRRLHRRKPMILLVEDDREILDIFSFQLGGMCQVVTAHDVETAGEMLTTMPIDCVVSDLHLGSTSGNGLIDYLERDPERLPVPIVIVTGDSNRDVQALSLQLGVEAVLTKPITGKRLLAAVQTAMIRAERQKARLMRHFSAVLESLVATPTPPEAVGYRLASRAATASLGGGDATLHFERGTTHRIVMLDAMGHGLGAKAAALALAAMARTLETIMAPDTASAFISALSALVSEEDAMSGFIGTALVLDLKPDGLSVASAGHPRPVLIGSDRIEPIDISGPPLGMIMTDPVKQLDLVLPEAVRLFACSDGLDPYGLACGEPPPEWLCKALLAKSDDENVMADRIAAICEETLGSEPEDDWSFTLIGAASRP
jgi:anti-sigma regulatory factor (Ser/Thr protein kinase)/CheY-like chemotaxis protein